MLHPTSLLRAELLCAVILIHTKADLIVPDMTPVVTFMQEFIQPYVPFVNHLLHPSRSGPPRDALTADEEEIASFIDKKVARVKPKETREGKIAVIELIKQRTEDLTK